MKHRSQRVPKLFVRPRFPVVVAAVLLAAALASSDGASAQRLTIEGQVWEDGDGNRTLGAEERLLGDVRVILYRGDRQIDEAATDAAGRYRFARLRASTYRVKVDESTLPLDLRFGQGERIYDVTRSIADADFGFVPNEVAERLAESAGDPGRSPAGSEPEAEDPVGSAPDGPAAGDPARDEAGGGEPAGDETGGEQPVGGQASGDGSAGSEPLDAGEGSGVAIGVWLAAILVIVVLLLLFKRRQRASWMTIEQFLARRDAQEWTEMESTFHKLRESDRSESFVRQQRAFGLNRGGAGETAERLLEEQLSEEGASPETCGILGRVFKDRWEASRDAGGEARAAELLATAIAHYLAGHDADPSDPYPGINALTLMESQPTLSERRESLLAEVSQAVADRPAADYWNEATRLELSILVGDRESATAALAAALDTTRTPWQVETTRRNLRLLREGRERKGETVPDWVRELEDQLG